MSLSLLEEAMEDCVMIEKTSVPDGYGGRTSAWQESSFTFKCAIVFDTSIEARIGEKQGVTSLYTVTTRKDIVLEYHEVFKRIEDGKIFRVTSDGDDKKTPNSAGLNMRQVTAEEWSLPNG